MPSHSLTPRLTPWGKAILDLSETGDFPSLAFITPRTRHVVTVSRDRQPKFRTPRLADLPKGATPGLTEVALVVSRREAMDELALYHRRFDIIILKLTEACLDPKAEPLSHVPTLAITLTESSRRLGELTFNEALGTEKNRQAELQFFRLFNELLGLLTLRGEFCLILDEPLWQLFRLALMAELHVWAIEFEPLFPGEPPSYLVYGHRQPTRQAGELFNPGKKTVPAGYSLNYASQFDSIPLVLQDFKHRLSYRSLIG